MGRPVWRRRERLKQGSPADVERMSETGRPLWTWKRYTKRGVREGDERCSTFLM